MLMIGQQVGNYRVVRHIASGGMGAVYEGQHQFMSVRAAIKVLLPDFAKDPALVARLFTEARAVNLVQHPGIVRILDCGQLDGGGAPYLVMEFLEGQSLADHMEGQGGRLHPPEWPLLAEIAGTMAAAHEQGIVHRDLKPDNVMLLSGTGGYAGRIKVLDFGIAKVAEERLSTSYRAAHVPTAAGSMMGTPPYMAPEQWRDVGTADARADVYALGVMLFQCVSGQLPFVGTMERLMYQHLEKPPPELRTFHPSAPREIAELVAAMLAKDPAARPSMKQVAEALRPRSAAAPQRELKAGLMLGNYRLVERLGRGGYGTVFLAEHANLHGLRVAIKVLHQELLQRPDVATRFQIEASAIGKLEHAGIVKLRDFGQAEGYSYLVMDYLVGQTLRDWLDANQGKSEAQRAGVELLRQVAAALSVAHRVGIVHRDLKPDNVMVVADPTRPEGLGVRVVDFGVAKLAGEHFGSLAQKAKTVNPIGTPAYMAPEQWKVEAVTGGADVYSLGVMLYECLAGERPFTGNSLALMNQHLTRTPRPLGDVDGTIPAELCALVDRMLRKLPAERPSMAEIEGALVVRDDTLPRPPAQLRTLLVPPPVIPQPPSVVVDMSTPQAVTPVAVPSKPPVPTEVLPLPPDPDPGPPRRRWLQGLLAAGGVVAVLVPLAYSRLHWSPVGSPDMVQAPSKVRWQIASEPAGAEIRRVADGVVVGKTPFVVELEPGAGAAEYELAYTSYQPRKISLDRAQGGERQETLEPAIIGESTLPETEARAALVPIAAGSFPMGSPKSEKDRDADEVPHRVTISHGFWLGRTEVTQGQYTKVMGSNPSNFKGADLPVEQVSWNDAVAYCNKLSAQEQLDACYQIKGSTVTWSGLGCKGYRLPTEAEWEYAARAGEGLIYAGSNEPDAVAWYLQNSGTKTHPVATKTANRWGLYDMSGNVWEWVWDWFADYNVKQTTDPIGSASGSNRVSRGGSFRNSPRILRVASRVWVSPGVRDRYRGFRLARSLP